MACAADTSDIVYTGAKLHMTSPVATAALGRLLTAAAIMGAQLKQDDASLTLRIKGDNSETGAVIAVSDSKGNVKGYLQNPDCPTEYYSNGKLNVSKAVGKTGILNVMKDFGAGEPYVGQVDLQSGEIGDDLTYYFAISEQVPSAVGLGVRMNKDNTGRTAGGFIFQVMPFAEDKTISRLEENVLKVKSVTELLDQPDMTPEKLLQHILGDMDLEINDRIDTSFYCNCSKERVEKALISIGRKDLNEMIQEGKDVELNCHFCNTNYVFSVEELKAILRKCK